MSWIKIRRAPGNQVVIWHMLQKKIYIYIFFFRQYHLSRSNVLLKMSMIFIKLPSKYQYP
jgi:hypothetical protein